MTQTIQSRINLILIISIAFMALIGGISLYYFNKISNDLDHLLETKIAAQLSPENTKRSEVEKKIINEILSQRHTELKKHQDQIGFLISNARRNMLLYMFICLLGGVILMVLSPKQVTAPFKRYIAALSEVEDLKFDTRLPIKGDDEVAQLGKTINRLIDRLKMFDDMKLKRIQFERSKQRVLANMLDQGVMMLAIEGEVLFLNDQLANALDLHSESYQGKDFHMVDIPDELKEMIEEVLKTKERIDSRMMILHDIEKNGDEKTMVEALVDAGLVRNYKGQVVNIIITFEDITNPPGESVFKRISITEQKLV